MLPNKKIAGARGLTTIHQRRRSRHHPLEKESTQIDTPTAEFGAIKPQAGVAGRQGLTAFTLAAAMLSGCNPSGIYSVPDVANRNRSLPGEQRRTRKWGG